MDLQDLKREVNFINQNATRKSFEILIQLLEKSGFATALLDAHMSEEMSEEFAKTMADTPADQPKMEQEDKDAQMEDGEEIPDADVVEQTEVEIEEEEPAPVDAEPTTGNQTTDAEPTTGDAPEFGASTTRPDLVSEEKVTITSEDVGEIKASDLL